MTFDRRDLLLALGIFLLALWVNLGAVPTTPFHRDEARWIHRARFAGEAMHPLSAYWSDRELMWGQPPLGSMLMGLGLVAQGQNLDTNGVYDFHFSEAWNRRHGNIPNESQLQAGRRTNSVVGALIAVCAFAIARGLSNRTAGVIAALLLIPHPLSVYLSSLAGSDALLTLTIALSALAAMALADRPTWPRALLLGLFIGLGAATKLSPLLVAVPLAALGFLLLIQAWRGRGADRTRIAALGWRLLPQPLIAGVVFIATYPYLWPNPLGRSLTLFSFRVQEMTNQGEIWQELYVAGPIDALSRVGNWLGRVDSTTAEVTQFLTSRVGQSWHPEGLDLPLAIAGALILAALVIRHGLTSRWAMAAIVLGGQTALIVVGLRADFSRYMYPVLLAQTVCAGLLVGEVWTLLYGAWQRRRSERTTPATQADLPATSNPATSNPGWSVNHPAGSSRS